MGKILIYLANIAISGLWIVACAYSAPRAGAVTDWFAAPIALVFMVFTLAMMENTASEWTTGSRKTALLLILAFAASVAVFSYAAFAHVSGILLFALFLAVLVGNYALTVAVSYYYIKKTAALSDGLNDNKHKSDT
ncbi:Uncharacterised protein [Kingella potus]|uniref:Uncharacterized protein n=1 Tax=Kingella potus TaxID=265175 RepID=A0A377QZ88_9NEIS|nr:hypothetical protein [Kingella potus]UOP01528.1 hypothetical protein LVJ84_04870 [Kingella potus]STR00179.1 Uncharacterised protein [Kingella potus]